MSDVMLYNDTVKLVFNEGDHRYLVSHLIGGQWTEGTPVTGVSSYCGAMAKDFLAPWAAKLAAEYMAKHRGSDVSNTVLIDEAKKQHRLAADVGKRAGKLGHAYVEAQLLGRAVTMPSADEDRKVIESVASAFEAFMADWKPEIVGIEEVVYSKTFNYAGTFDGLVRVKDQLIILDWKTTNTSRYNPDGIYASYFAQLGAYCLAYEEESGNTIKDLWAVNLPKDGGQYKLKRLSDIGSKTDALHYFLALRNAYELNNKFEFLIKK